MKKLILFLTLLLTSVFVFPQITFQKYYSYTDHETAYCVLEMSDGGYIASGECGSQTGIGFVFRTNAYGDTIWKKGLGGNLGMRFYNMKRTSDSCFILCGYSDLGIGGYSALLVKINSEGDIIWQKGYGGVAEDGAKDVIQTYDGGYAVTGYTMSYGQATFTGYFIKTDSNGDTLWTKTYEKSSFYNSLGSLIQLADSGYIISGVTENPDDDIYLIRSDKKGDTIWTKTIGGTGDDGARFVQPTSDGGFLLCGGTTSYGAGGRDVYIVKINSNGQVLWSKTIGGPNDDSGGGIPTSDGGYAIWGTTNSFGVGGYDGYLLKLNSNCDTLWTRTFGSDWNDFGNSIQETSDGGFILCGWSNNWDFSGSIEKAYLIKTDANGHVVGIDENSFSIKNLITAFPNPTNGIINIQIPQLFGQTKTLEVFDFVGQLQLSKTDNITEIDISNLTSGLYFLVLTNTDNERQTIKIIKE
jgi:hypothetical protein